MARDAEIRRRLERVEEIVERLEAGECSRSEAEALYEEGKENLIGARSSLNDSPGNIIELE